MKDVRAGQHGGVVPGLVLEPDGSRLDSRPQLRDESDRGGAGDEHRGRDEHGERRPVPAGLGLAGLLCGHLGHLGVLRRRITEAVEHSSRDAQHRPAGQDGAGDEHAHHPGQSVRPGAVIDVGLAEEGGEWRQVGQPEGGLVELVAYALGRDDLEAAPAVQPGLVDRSEPVQHDPGAQEQGRLDQAVTDHVDGGAGQAERREQADADQEHARVADGGEGQQPLDVPLAEAEQRAHHGRQHAQGQEHVRNRGPVPERLAEHRPVDPGDPVQAEFHHHAGEQHADRRRRHRVRVREPEMERHDGTLDQQARDDQQERYRHQPVGRVTADVHADLGHVERPGAGVDQADAAQHQVGAHAVGDGEGERALDRPAFFRAVGGQRVGRHAH